MVRKAVCVAVD